MALADTDEEGGRLASRKGNGDGGAEKKVKSRISFAQIIFSSGNVLTLLILEQICSPTFTFNPYGWQRIALSDVFYRT